MVTWVDNNVDQEVKKTTDDVFTCDDTGEIIINDEVDPCVICLHGDTFEGNEILFCDKCNVAVHQMCYGVSQIPNGAWFCDVCANDGDPSTTKCELCSTTSSPSGAFKPVDEPNKWCHVLCSNWIPEVYCLDPSTVKPFHVADVDPKRYKLRCKLCSQPGACIQCAYGRCTAAAHPICALQKDTGFKYRIVKTGQGNDCLWEIYCKEHAAHVKDPVVIRKVSPPKAQPEKNDNENTHGRSNHSSSRPRRDYAMPAILSPYAKDWGEIGGVMSRWEKLLCEQLNFRQLFKVKGTTKKAAQSDSSSSSSSSSSSKNGPEVKNFAEWPGQSEGEPLDLDHYWDVMNMYFPDAQPRSWLDAVLEPIFNAEVDVENEKLAELGEWSHESFEEHTDTIEEIYSHIPDKERYTVLDMKKRLALIKTVCERISNMTDAKRAAEAERILEFDEDEFLLEQSTQMISFDSNKTNDKQIHVVFDGDSRQSATFTVSLDGSCSMNGDTESSSSILPSSSDIIIGSGTVGLSSDADVNVNATLDLVEVKPVSTSSPIRLPDKQIVAKDNDDLYCRMIRTDQRLLIILSKVLDEKIKTLIEDHFSTTNTKFQSMSRSSKDDIERKYKHQRCWKQIASSIVRGTRDQEPDFNKKDTAEALPASWTIAVDGRPPKTEALDEEGEDAVCMCCFDGASVDGNNILFCDGCNATMHQKCYGVSEIPEGDFFCDRCEALQLLVESTSALHEEFEPRHARTAISCCMCPVQHGALKITSDGRWVHLCCAIWSKDAVITNLEEMSPIDVENVDIKQASMINEDLRSRRLMNADPAEVEAANKERSNACKYCKQGYGYIKSCDTYLEDGTKCDCKFHPLCAWFHGCLFESALTDPTFMGNDRNGIYPSGVDIKVHCDMHSKRKLKEDKTVTDVVKVKAEETKAEVAKIEDTTIASASTSTSLVANGVPDVNNNHVEAVHMSLEQQEIPPPPSQQQEQQVVPVVDEVSEEMKKHEHGIKAQAVLRKKYQIAIEDLNGMPGHMQRKRKSKRHPSIGHMSGSNQPEMAADVYAKDCCAICLCADGPVECMPCNLLNPFPPSPMITCKICGISAHASCLNSVGASASVTAAADGGFQCWSCASTNPDAVPGCKICPRRGGMVQLTSLGFWSHFYCARTCVGMFVDPANTDGVIVLKGMWKEVKSLKCQLCTRKGGALFKCNHPECRIHIHPLCGKFNSRAYVQTRGGQCTVYCSKHIPKGVLEIAPNFNIDEGEMQNLRLSLDRARMNIDSSRRRDKLKKQIYDTEKELFNSRLTTLLENAEKLENEEITLDEALDVDLNNEYIEPVINETALLNDAYADQSRRRGRLAGAPKFLDDMEDFQLFDDEDDIGRQKKRRKRDSLGSGTSASVVAIDREPTYKVWSMPPNRSLKEVKMANGETKMISSSFMRYSTIAIPTVVVNLTGIKIPKEKCSGAVSADAFHSSVTTLLSESRFATREMCGIFESDADGVQMEGELADLLSMCSERKYNNEFMELMKKAKIMVPEAERFPKSRATTVTMEEVVEDKKVTSKSKGSVTTSSSSSSSSSKKKSNTDLSHYDACVHTVATDPILSDLFSKESGDFDNLFRSSGLLDLYNDEDFKDWQLVKGKDKLALERRIQDILFCVTDLTEPSSNADDDEEDGKDERQLAFDFLEIPYDIIPEYDSLVRRPVSVGILYQKLQDHEYTSMSTFTADFFEMLNNGRRITEPGSQTWIDSEGIAEEMERAKELAENNTPRQHMVAVDKSMKARKKNKKSARSDEEEQRCSKCKSDYFVTNWPKSNKNGNGNGTKGKARGGRKRTPNKDEWSKGSPAKSSNSSWNWVCPSCIQATPEEAIGWNVKVWWADDAEFYEGHIDSYESVGARHRVVYTDGEWEFVDMINEPMLVQN